MNVLCVIDSIDRPGGAEQALAAMAPCLVAHGVTLDVAYLLDRPGFQPELEAAGAHLWPVIRSARWDRIRALKDLVHDRSPDLVHTTLFEADLAGRCAGAWARVPVVSSLVNSSYGPEHRHAPGLRPWKVRAAQTLDILSARAVRRFHAITHHVADTMAPRLRIPPERIDVVPRGRDPAVLGRRTPPRRQAVRRGLGIGDTTPLLLAAARHEYQKGLDILVGALPSVRRAVPDTVLLVAGRAGTETGRLRDLARWHGVDRAMMLLGPRTDVPDLMCAADVVVAPSRWEGLGSTVLEAMAVGTPIVASDIAAIRETVGSPRCAVLVPAEHPDALAAAVVTTLRDETAASRRAAAAQERFHEHFTADRIVAGMLGFYRRALNGCS